MTINQYLSQHNVKDASLNACAQALKRIAPELSRREFLKTLGVPDCMNANTRYWYESYNIKPWSDRLEVERIAAMSIAEFIIRHLEPDTRPDVDQSHGYDIGEKQ